MKNRIHETACVLAGLACWLAAQATQAAQAPQATQATQAPQATQATQAAPAQALPLSPAPRLGRLFLTPEERSLLDRARAGERVSFPGIASGEAAPADQPPPPPEPPLTFSGFVKRDKGRSTVWLGKDAGVIEEAPNRASRLSSASSVTVVLPSGKKAVLKVGQSIDPATGRVRDVFEPLPPTEGGKP